MIDGVGESATGQVYLIERFALHDGPGIRTLVMLKGCPLYCLWCSSPQTRCASPDILYDADRCESSGRCAEVCPQSAIVIRASGGIEIDPSVLKLMTFVNISSSGIPLMTIWLHEPKYIIRLT